PSAASGTGDRRRVASECWECGRQIRPVSTRSTKNTEELCCSAAPNRICYFSLWIVRHDRRIWRKLYGFPESLVNYFLGAICAMNVPQFASKVLGAAGMYSVAIQIAPCSSAAAAE